MSPSPMELILGFLPGHAQLAAPSLVGWDFNAEERRTRRKRRLSRFRCRTSRDCRRLHAGFSPSLRRLWGNLY
jgi:hypothetical protein